MGDELSAAQISASGQILSAGINYASASSANRKGRKWAEEMYGRQRQDALTDWQMQNDYNSPAANMKRLREAGLNPNLVYGDGANTPSVQIRSSQPQSWKPEAPQVNLDSAANSLMRGIELKNTEQQTDNLRTQQRLIEQQIIGEAARTQATGSQTARSQFDLQQLQAKAMTDIEQVKANLRQTEASTAATEANTQYTIDENKRKQALQEPNLLAALKSLKTTDLHNLQTQQQTENTRIQTQKLQHEIQNLESDNQLKQFDVALRARGINPGDPSYMRALKEVYRLMPTTEKLSKYLEQSLKKLEKGVVDWFIPMNLDQ